MLRIITGSLGCNTLILYLPYILQAGSLVYISTFVRVQNRMRSVSDQDTGILSENKRVLKSKIIRDDRGYREDSR